jgi:putative addiction module CopG family antidote
MSTMNISLPDTLKSFVNEQVNQGSYGTSSEYVRELIRKDQERLHLLIQRIWPTLRGCVTGCARRQRTALAGDGQACRST